MSALHPLLEDGEQLSLIGAGLTSLDSLRLSSRPSLRSLHLHGNNLTDLGGHLDLLGRLVELDLSSNRLREIRGLECLWSLQILNVASNQLTRIDGISSLRQLRVLNVSFNSIASLSGLRQVKGPEYALTELDLRNNSVALPSEFAHLADLIHLQSLKLEGNPVSAHSQCRALVFASLPTLRCLDGLNKAGQPQSEQQQQQQQQLLDMLTTAVTTSSLAASAWDPLKARPAPVATPAPPTTPLPLSSISATPGMSDAYAAASVPIWPGESSHTPKIDKVLRLHDDRVKATRGSHHVHSVSDEPGEEEPRSQPAPPPSRLPLPVHALTTAGRPSPQIHDEAAETVSSPSAAETVSSPSAATLSASTTRHAKGSESRRRPPLATGPGEQHHQHHHSQQRESQQQQRAAAVGPSDAVQRSCRRQPAGLSNTNIRTAPSASGAAAAAAAAGHCLSAGTGANPNSDNDDAGGSQASGHSLAGPTIASRRLRGLLTARKSDSESESENSLNSNGHERASEMETDDSLPLEDLRDMRALFPASGSESEAGNSSRRRHGHHGSRHRPGHAQQRPEVNINSEEMEEDPDDFDASYLAHALLARQRQAQRRQAGGGGGGGGGEEEEEEEKQGYDLGGRTRFSTSARSASRRAPARSASGRATDVTFQLGRELFEERQRRQQAEKAAAKLREDVASTRHRSSQTEAQHRETLKLVEELERSLQSSHTRQLSLEDALQQQDAYRLELERAVKALEHRTKTLHERLERSNAAVVSKEKELSGQQQQLSEQLAATQKAAYERKAKMEEALAETEGLRRALQMAKAQVQQMQELLAAREAQHVADCKDKVLLEGPEVQRRVTDAAAAARVAAEGELAALKQQLALQAREYQMLENEFRSGLQSEELKQRHLQGVIDELRRTCAGKTAALRESETREQQAAAAIHDLGTVVKEQRERMALLSGERAQAEQACTAAAQALQQANCEAAARLQELGKARDEAQAANSRVAALENVIRGLREERALWSRELAAQGAALAADRGSLESRVVALGNEVAQLKQQNAEANEALQIKGKMLDDQIDSLRKSKSAMAERERELKRLREEQQRREDDLKDRLEAERALSQQLQDDLQAAHDKRAKLKSALADADAELELLRKETAAMRAAEQERAVRLAEAELDVQQQRAAYQRRERELLAERNAAVAALETADGRLSECAALFQQQMEQKQQHIRSLTEQLQQLQVLLEAANARVRSSEDDMRALLHESERRQQAAQQRLAQMRRLFHELNTVEAMEAMKDS